MAYEIKCSDFGHAECNWKAVSNTEDKLVDLVAVHARDHHGVANFTQEMIAQVKNSLSNVVDIDEESEELTVKEYHCKDCSWRYMAQTTDLIVDAVAVHARDEHGVNVFSEEMRTEVRRNLNPWQG